jgi:hypothetical protein
LKYLLLLLLNATVLLSADRTYECKLYSSILESIFPDKKVIYVWTDLPKGNPIYDIKKVIFVKEKNKADILMIQNITKIKTNKIKFALSYRVFNKYLHDIIGGFYWQKGRANLIFIKSNLDKYHIKLPHNMQTFIEHKL